MVANALAIRGNPIDKALQPIQSSPNPTVRNGTEKWPKLFPLSLPTCSLKYPTLQKKNSFRSLWQALWIPDMSGFHSQLSTMIANLKC